MPILGMLGGVCGEPVSVWLQDYPPDHLAALYRFIRGHVSDEMVCEVFRPADLRGLTRDPGRLAIVLVYPVPGHATAGLVAQWLLERRRDCRLPSVLFCGERCDREAPGAILSLRAGPKETATLGNWLASGPRPDRRVRGFLTSSRTHRVEASFAGLPALFGTGSDAPLWMPRSLRPILTLRGLLAGRRLLRRIAGGMTEFDSIAPGLDDYAGVYDALLNSKAGLIDESGDPILVAMIRRANLYVRHLDRSSDAAVPVHAGRDGLASVTDRRREQPPARNGPISLRELADLGDPRSKITRELIKVVLESNEAGSAQELGLCRKLPEQTDPGYPGKEAITRLLVTWSMKQVRNRFDRLRRQGFIQAERIPPGNGPWVISLPRELTPLTGEFEGLPTVAQVAAASRLEG